VGELYCGRGTFERHLPSILSQNKLPDVHNFPAGTGVKQRSNAWAHARLIAFDIPECNWMTPREAWPYCRRYALLINVVGAWPTVCPCACKTVVVARRLTLGTPLEKLWPMLPCQVIRQYPMADLLTFCTVHPKHMSIDERAKGGLGTIFL
jgi:hypothetical protein